jgi:hypothetical protein
LEEVCNSYKVVENPDKILTVETEDITAEDIVKTVKTGFTAEAFFLVCSQ